MGPFESMHFVDFRERLNALVSDPEASRALAENYIAARKGDIPIVEGNTAHFIYSAKPDVVVGVAGEWNGNDGRYALMSHIGGGLLHYEHDFEPDARLDYLFAEYDLSLSSARIDLADTRWAEAKSKVKDPLNRHIGESGLGDRSELAMPEYRRPPITLEQPSVTIKGLLRKRTIRSKAQKREREYTVYEPVGYDERQGPYASIYFHDGGDYLTMGKAPTILDNLIAAGAIPPIVAVFLPPIEREKEYGNCDDRYVSFICDELVPEIGSSYSLSADPGKRSIFGPSLGGLISLYIGSQRPEIFGLVGAQSSVVRSWGRADEWDAMSAYAVEPPLPLRLHMVIGTYEDCFNTTDDGKCRDLLTPVRDFREVLRRYGYAHEYAEQHQGHSWGLWRDCLADALVYFFRTIPK